MLTPRELRQIEFRRVFRGYDPQEVDEFLGRLIEEYEALFKERQAEPAQPRPVAPEGERARHRGGHGSDSVREAVELARKAAEELRSNAQWEARLILDEARQRATRIEEEARQQAAVERTRLRELREEVDRLLRHLRRLTDAYLQAENGLPEPERNRRDDRPDPEPPTGTEEEGETRSFPIGAPHGEESPGEGDAAGSLRRRYGRGSS